MNALQRPQNPKGFEQPKNHHNDDNAVQYTFDFAIHRDIIVDEPKQDTDNDKDEYYI